MEGRAGAASWAVAEQGSLAAGHRLVAGQGSGSGKQA